MSNTRGRHGMRAEIRELNREEAEALLERNHVGRMAYSHLGRAEIVPLGYVYADGGIYARTSPGTKLTAVQHDDRVTFEVDEVETPLDWRSVIARCVFEPLRPVGSNDTIKTWERAVALLGDLIPETLSAEDPVPHRWFLFRLRIEELTGRASRLVAGPA